MRASRGFTLIELLVVIAIIGLMAAVVLEAVGASRNKGADTTVKAQLHTVRSESELFSLINGNSYSNLCTTAVSSNGLGGSTAGGILYVAADATGNGARITTAAATAGAYNYVTCHSNSSTWMVEAPLTVSVSGSPRMWCVDSLGAAKLETTNVAANVYACP